MKALGVVTSCALLGVRFTEGSTEPWQQGPSPFGGQPVGLPQNVPLPQGPLWQAAPTAPAPLPRAPSAQFSSQQTQSGHLQQNPVVTYRTLVPADAAPVTAEAGSRWINSKTGAGAQALLSQVDYLFHDSSDSMTWPHIKVMVPVENLKNALMELSKLIRAVITYCDAEFSQQMSQGLPGQPGEPLSSLPSTADKFPVDAFISQGSKYARRMTDHMLALRDFLRAVTAPSVTKESAQREAERFKAATADIKEVFQDGYQVCNAAVGAVLPYASRCSLFPKNDPEGSNKLWSLVGARISSTLRYLYHVLKVMRVVSSKLVQHVAGKVPAQSLQDYARSRRLFRAATHLKTAEERSVSAVRYFNELAAAYATLTRPSAPSAAAQPDVKHEGRVQPFLDVQSVGTDINADLSLMQDDLDHENAMLSGDKSAAASFELDGPAAMQEPTTGQTFLPWRSTGYPAGDRNEDDDILHALGSDGAD